MVSCRPQTTSSQQSASIWTIKKRICTALLLITKLRIVLLNRRRKLVTWSGLIEQPIINLLMVSLQNIVEGLHSLTFTEVIEVSNGDDVLGEGTSGGLWESAERRLSQHGNINWTATASDASKNSADMCYLHILYCYAPQRRVVLFLIKTNWITLIQNWILSLLMLRYCHRHKIRCARINVGSNGVM